MKSLIKLGLLIAVIAIVYYRFYGTEEQQETSKKITNKAGDLAKDLGRLTWDLLKQGKQSLEEGDYDETIEHISGVIDDLKEKAGDTKEVYDKIRELEKKRDELQADLASKQVQTYGTEASGEATATTAAAEQPADTDAELKNDIKNLLRDAEALMEQVEGN